MKLDSIDVETLRILQRDARASLREMSHRVGVSTPTVSKRVKAMETIGLIRGYGASVAPEGLEQTSILLAIHADPAKLRRLGRELADRDTVRRVYVAGDMKLMVEATLDEETQLPDMLEAIGSMDGVESYEVFHSPESLKDAPRAIVREGASAVLTCFYCGETIHDEPVKFRMDGRTHYLCCNTCRREYKAKYERIKAGA